MADTQRTQTALAALLADNTAGDISAQDVRDFLLSTKPSIGELYFSSPAATTITVADTFYKAAGTTTSGTLFRFTMPSNNRLTYSGTATVNALVIATVELWPGTAAARVSADIAKNGTVIGTAPCGAKTSGFTADDSVAVSVSNIVSLATSDYLELFVTNQDATNEVTVARGKLIVMSALT